MHFFVLFSVFSTGLSAQSLENPSRPFDEVANIAALTDSTLEPLVEIPLDEFPVSSGKRDSESRKEGNSDTPAPTLIQVSSPRWALDVCLQGGNIPVNARHQGFFLVPLRARPCQLLI